MFQATFQGKTYTNRISFINHICKGAFKNCNEPMKAAWMFENKIKEVPICPYCQKNEKKFLNYNLGFSPHCGNKKCKQEFIKKVFLTNVELYVENFPKTYVLDPFLERHSCHKTLRWMFTILFGKKDLINEKEFLEIPIEEKNCICGKKWNFTVNDLIFGRGKKTCGCKTSKAPVIKTPKIKQESKCVYCGKTYTLSWRKSPVSCSKECYFSLLRNKELRTKYFPNMGSIQSRTKQSDNIRKRIIEGSFTPPVTNSWCKSRVKVSIRDKIYYCRSSWESVFLLFNPELLYESIRIPYFSPKYNKKRIYITDFEDRKNRIIYEVKPESCLDNEEVHAKIEAASKWCHENSYTFKIISENYFKSILTKEENIRIIDHAVGKETLTRLQKGLCYTQHESCESQINHQIASEKPCD